MLHACNILQFFFLFCSECYAKCLIENQFPVVLKKDITEIICYEMYLSLVKECDHYFEQSKFYSRILYTKFAWNWSNGSGKSFFKIIIDLYVSKLKCTQSFTWTMLNQSFVLSLVGPVVFSIAVNELLLFSNYLLLELYLNKLESSLIEIGPVVAWFNSRIKQYNHTSNNRWSEKLIWRLQA